jgi:hypothetical protein
MCTLLILCKWIQLSCILSKYSSQRIKVWETCTAHSQSRTRPSVSTAYMHVISKWFDTLNNDKTGRERTWTLFSSWLTSDRPFRIAHPHCSSTYPPGLHTIRMALYRTNCLSILANKRRSLGAITYQNRYKIIYLPSFFSSGNRVQLWVHQTYQIHWSTIRQDM